MIKFLWSIVIVGVGLLIMIAGGNAKAVSGYEFPADYKPYTFKQCVVDHRDHVRIVNGLCFDLTRGYDD